MFVSTTLCTATFNTVNLDEYEHRNKYDKCRYYACTPKNIYVYRATIYLYQRCLSSVKYLIL